MPLFSIVMPTRNRCHLLRYALGSALGQAFTDYEIVVSDNCSSDDTPLVVRELSNGKVRYVRSERALSMPDSWEFALSHARGDYVTFLCDDDAWCLQTLERVAGIIERDKPELLNVMAATYRHKSWYVPEERNCVYIPFHTGNIIEYDSRWGLANLFSFRNQVRLPKLLDSFCKMEAIRRIRTKCPRIFLGSCPDYSFSAVILSEIDRWTHIDVPLLVAGTGSESIGATATYNRGESFASFVREFEEGELLRSVRVTIPVVTSFIADTLLVVKQSMVEKLADFDIDREEFLINCWKDLSRLKSAGVDVSKDRQELLCLLSSELPEMGMPARLKRQVHLRGNDLVASLMERSAIFRRLMRSAWITWRRAKGMRFIRGSKAGFSNILECASHVGKLL